MEFENLLLTTAQVAMAFAGFTGVVSVFGRSRSSTPEELQAYRLRQMISTSLGTLSIALTPLLLHALGVGEVASWRASSAIYVPLMGGFTARGIYQSRGFYRDGSASLPVSITLAVGTLIAVCAAGLNAFGWFAQTAGGVYLACTWWTLALSGIFFSRLVASLRPAGGGRESD